MTTLLIAAQRDTSLGGKGGRPPIEQLQMTLSQGGRSLPLSKENGFSVQHSGVEGLDGATTSALEVDGAGLDGTFITDVRTNALDVWLPMLVSADTLTGLDMAKQQLRDITNPRHGPVRLTVTRDNGYSRWVEGVRLNREMAAWTQDRWSATGWQFLGLSLRCPDPYWRADAAPVVWQGPVVRRLYPYNAGAGLPYRVNSSRNIDEDTPILVDADAGSYPFWRATGPATAITALHVDSGRTWTVTETLAAAEVLIVDTDPRNAAKLPSIRAEDGTSRYSSLAAPRDLWPLPPGPQTVKVTVTGLGAGTSVSMLPVPLWESA